jgi:hypothetical protein
MRLNKNRKLESVSETKGKKVEIVIIDINKKIWILFIGPLAKNV